MVVRIADLKYGNRDYRSDPDVLSWLAVSWGHKGFIKHLQGRERELVVNMSGGEGSGLKPEDRVIYNNHLGQRLELLLLKLRAEDAHEKWKKKKIKK